MIARNTHFNIPYNHDIIIPATKGLCGFRRKVQNSSAIIMMSRVSLLLALCFLVGCATNSGVKRVNQPDRSLVVVPVKGQPIIVRSIHTASTVFGGVVGGLIEQSLSTDSSNTLCARLNQYSKFNGERILAEESVKLLRASPKVGFHEVSLHPLDAAMPGITQLPPAEQTRFKVNPSCTFKWNDNFYAWKASPPVASSSLLIKQRTVFLEVTFLMVILNHQDTLAPAAIYMRVIDATSGEMLGFTGSFENYDISEVTASSDLSVFEADFRKSMNKTARNLLRDLNLL